MKQRIKKGIAILLSTVLTAATCITTIPQLSAIVYAAGNGKNLQLGSAALAETGTVVYYGSEGDAIEWKVIDYKRNNGIASGSEEATLISSEALGTTKFSNSEGRYENSLLHSEVNSILSNRFTTQEQADQVMVARTLAGKSEYSEAYASGDSSYIWGENLTGQKLWPLSTVEAKQLYNYDNSLTNIGSFWWLRSPGFTINFAARVSHNGDVYDNGLNVVYEGGCTPRF